MAGLRATESGLRGGFNALQDTMGQTRSDLADLETRAEELGAFQLLTSAFNDWRLTWERKPETGSLAATPFDIQVVKTCEETGPRLINPQPNGLFVCVNTSNQNWGVVTRPNEENTNKYSRVNVINARTKELVSSMEMTDEGGFTHTTSITPDGRYSYVIGAGSYSAPEGAVMWKVDALTLQPVKKIKVGGTVHHMQILRDRYMLVDMFSLVDGGLKVFLMDPETDEMIGGLDVSKLGGSSYTAWGDPAGEFIYLLMQPSRDPMYTASGLGGLWVGAMYQPIYRVAKIDPDTWEVAREFHYPGTRSDWIQFTPGGDFMYVDGYIDETISKINLATGELVWRTDTGTGHYAIELNADGSEVWVADKGESGKAHKGRTLTVIDDATGTRIDTIVHGGRGVGHIILSLDGTEVWASANDSGTVFVIDAVTHETTAEIPLPQFGDPHGFVFVYYDENGVGRVVADQGDFHGM